MGTAGGVDADAMEFGVELEAQAEFRPVDDMEEVVVFSDSCTELGFGSNEDDVDVTAGVSMVCFISSQNSSLCRIFGTQLPTVSCNEVDISYDTS